MALQQLETELSIEDYRAEQIRLSELTERLSRELTVSRARTAELEGNLERETHDLSSLAAEFDQLTRVLRGKDQDIARIISESEAKDSAVAQLYDQLASGDKNIDDLEYEIMARDDVIVAAEVQIEQLMNLVAQLNEENSQHHRELTELKTQLDQLAILVHGRNELLAATNQELDASKAHLDRTYGSWSWRLTKPLRAVNRLR